MALLGSGIAFAQEPRAQEQRAPAPAERELGPDERARELYLQGDRLYAEGNYDEAIVALKEAYDLSRRPALLFNIANAYERLGRYEEALLYLNQYAPSAPEHQRHIVLKRIRALELRAEEKRQERPSAAPSAPGAASGRAAPESTSPAEARLEAAPPSPLASPEADATKRQSLLGYAVGGAGLVAIGVGTVFGMSASSLRSDAEGDCVNNGADVLCPASARDSLSDADSRALVADIAWGLGLAAVGVGVYLVLDASKESGTSTALRSTVTAGGAGVSLVHAF